MMHKRLSKMGPTWKPKETKIENCIDFSFAIFLSALFNVYDAFKVVLVRLSLHPISSIMIYFCLIYYFSLP